jgi:hypothetical protein
MGFLKDMRNLEQQADGTAAPADAPDLALHGLAGAAAVPSIQPAAVAPVRVAPADPSSVTLG